MLNPAKWVLFLFLSCVCLRSHAAAQIPAASFADDFETDKGWFLFEEIVGGNPCYAENIGSMTQVNGPNVSPSRSMRMWANQAQSLSSNHIIGVQRVAYAGRTGKWRYRVKAYIDPSTATYQTGPEFSMQNTRRAPSGRYLTYIVGMQYQASPYAPDSGSWTVWAEVAPGVATWIPLAVQPLAQGTWYTLTIDADYDSNEYLRFSIQGGNINQVFNLTGVKIAGQDVFSEETLDLTIEAENLWNNCGEAGVWDARIYYDDVDLSPSITPAVGVMSPSTISGDGGLFTFAFQAADATHPINVANVLLNDSLDGANACYLAYSRPSNVLYLVNDAGTALLPGTVMNGSGTLTNSTCTVNLSGSSAVVNGNVLTLSLNIHSTELLANRRNATVFAAARDAQGANSGWQVRGIWLQEIGTPLIAATSFLQSGTGGSGVTQTFSGTYRHPSGGSLFTNAQVLINGDISGTGGCWIGYDPASHLLYLVNDDGTGTLPPLPIGSNGTRENRQCRINGAPSSAVVAGLDLTLNLNISFKIVYSHWRVFSAAQTSSGMDGWRALGTWSVNYP